MFPSRPLNAAYSEARRYGGKEQGSHSLIRVRHLGPVRDAQWEAPARAEMAVNLGYHCQGEVPFWRARRAVSLAVT